MGIKLVVTFIYFSWPKCFAVGDAINACLPLEEATHTAKDDSCVTPGAVATGRLGGWCWGRGCGGQGGKYCWDGEETLHKASIDAAEEGALVSGLLLLCLSSAASPSPLSSRGLSASGSWCSASPSLCRNPFPLGVSVFGIFVWFCLVFFGRVVLFLVGFFFGMSELLQQDDANSRHADCPLAVFSKTVRSYMNLCPFMGTFFHSSMAALPSHPAAEGPVRSQAAGRMGQCVPEPAKPVTSAYSPRSPACHGRQERDEALSAANPGCSALMKVTHWLCGNR